jgi:hypothetical protein
MGGNACFVGQCAEPIVIHGQATRDLYQDRISHLFTAINHGLWTLTDKRLWAKDTVIENFLSGSIGHLFNPKISTEELLRSKRFFGDIDIQFDKTRMDDVTKFLNLIVDQNFKTFTLLGWERTFSDTIITIWRDTVTEQNYQLDLEAEEFENNLPTEWSKFSRSSSWVDTRLYIKGFAHKYIWRAMTATNLFETWVQLKTKKVRKKITPVVFSPKGARVKYRQIGNDLWEEIPMEQSALVRDVSGLFDLFFGGEPSEEDLSKMHSFTGVVELIMDYRDPDQFEAIMGGMEHLLWGTGAQGIVREDPKADFSLKAVVYSYMADKLGCDQAGWNEDAVDEYYKHY